MIEPRFTLPEAAIALGITPDDVADPVRYVRDLIRKHEIPFVRHGRTVKLNQDQLTLLSERMIEWQSSSRSTQMGTGMSRGQLSSGVRVERIRKKFVDRLEPRSSQKPKVSDAKSKATPSSKTSPVENPFSRSTRLRTGMSKTEVKNAFWANLEKPSDGSV